MRGTPDMTMRYGLIVSALLLGVALSVSAFAQSDEEAATGDGSAPMVINVVSVFSSTGGTVSRALYGRIAATVDGVICDLVEVADNPAVNRPGAVAATLVVGLPEQPPECSAPGARVVLVRGDGYPLVIEFTFEAGTAHQLTNFHPIPPHSGGAPIVLPDTGSGGLAGGSHPYAQWWFIVIVATGGALLLLGARRAYRSR
jgi:hypothetical protein